MERCAPLAIPALARLPPLDERLPILWPLRSVGASCAGMDAGAVSRVIAGLSAGGWGLGPCSELVGIVAALLQLRPITQARTNFRPTRSTLGGMRENQLEGRCAFPSVCSPQRDTAPWSVPRSCAPKAPFRFSAARRMLTERFFFGFVSG